MKKFLMLLVLLALIAGKRSYAQPPTWPLDIENTGYLTLNEGGTFDDYDLGLVNHVLNPVFGNGVGDGGHGDGPSGWYIEGGDNNVLPTGVSRTSLYVQAHATGYDSGDNFDLNSDVVIGNGVVDVFLPEDFDWYLYSEVVFEWTEYYSDGTWEDFAMQWD